MHSKQHHGSFNNISKTGGIVSLNLNIPLLKSQKPLQMHAQLFQNQADILHMQLPYATFRPSLNNSGAYRV